MKRSQKVALGIGAGLVAIGLGVLVSKSASGESQGHPRFKVQDYVDLLPGVLPEAARHYFILAYAPDTAANHYGIYHMEVVGTASTTDLFVDWADANMTYVSGP
jgi:hypothetical protein